MLLFCTDCVVVYQNKYMHMSRIVLKAVLLVFGLSWLLCAQAFADKLTHALLMAKADVILQLIKSEDFVALSEHVHEACGLGFSPYSRNLSELFITEFHRGEVANFGTDNRKYFWGYYDGIGSPIRLTPKDYFAQFVYDTAFETKAEKFFLNPDDLQKNADFRAVYNAYPDSNFVYYHFAGTEEAAFKDFKDLILIFSEFDGVWYLIGLTHGESTI